MQRKNYYLILLGLLFSVTTTFAQNTVSYLWEQHYDAGNYVYGFVQNSQTGDVWIASDQGLVVYQPATETWSAPFPPPLSLQTSSWWTTLPLNPAVTKVIFDEPRRLIWTICEGGFGAFNIDSLQWTRVFDEYHFPWVYTPVANDISLTANGSPRVMLDTWGYAVLCDTTWVLEPSLFPTTQSPATKTVSVADGAWCVTGDIADASREILFFLPDTLTTPQSIHKLSTIRIDSVFPNFTKVAAMSSKNGTMVVAGKGSLIIGNPFQSLIHTTFSDQELTPGWMSSVYAHDSLIWVIGSGPSTGGVEAYNYSGNRFFSSDKDTAHSQLFTWRNGSIILTSIFETKNGELLFAGSSGGGLSIGQRVKIIRTDINEPVITPKPYLKKGEAIKLFGEKNIDIYSTLGQLVGQFSEGEILTLPATGLYFGHTNGRIEKIYY